MGTPTQVCVRSYPNISAPAGRPFRCVKSKISTLVFVDSESSTQADGAQSSRVPVPLLEDPYEAISQAYLDGTDTESEPFEDPIDIETPELPLTIAPPISLSKSIPPVLVPILRRTARMVVCVPHTMSSGLSASMAEVAAMSESAFCKRFWSSCESSPSVSPPDLSSQKHYRGTSELVDNSEEEDEEIEDSIDSDSLSENVEDEGPTVEDEDPAVEDEGLTVRVEGPGIDDESYGLDSESHGMVDESRGLDDEGHSVKSDGLDLEEEEAIHGESERPERMSASRQPTLTTWTDPEDGSQVEMQGGLIHDHKIRLEELSPALFGRYGRDIGELFTRSRAVREEIFSQRYRFRSLEYKQERVVVTFGVIWRPGENRDLQLQLAEERHARLELAKVVDDMRKGQEPRGDA
ncbi:hypothetical protein Tco_0877419 [Tanacetum coccineum]|uniref:Uncharacterized protein n=1 Tax=Tanacetum coccineum TaxID=301880 RepID=A0ABQ5BWJ7_9ASTR